MIFSLLSKQKKINNKTQLRNPSAQANEAMEQGTADKDKIVMLK